MKLVNVETYDTKIYTFGDDKGQLYHVIKQDNFLNDWYPEYRFMGHNQKEIVDDKIINEIKSIMENWKK
jgi:hypothetical protein